MSAIGAGLTAGLSFIDGDSGFYAGLLLSVMVIAFLVTIVIMMVMPPLPVGFLGLLSTGPI
jgi:hypothetical protein